MNIVAFSDTHERHHQLQREHGIPSGDLLIFAGDATVSGKPKAIELFAKWWNDLDFQHKIFIAGNHDHWANTHHKDKALSHFDDQTTYLEDETITIDGYTIHGSPWTPHLGPSHGMRKQDDFRETVYSKIPSTTDILVTHSPPYKYGDRTSAGKHIGDEVLAETLEDKNVELHLFGHCHENYGMHGGGRWNVSVTDNDYIVSNPPVELQL